MKLIACDLALILVAAWGVPPAVAQEKSAAPYKFTKDEVSKYDVVGELRISLKGSHAEFIPGGHEEAIVMSYRAQFENVVLEVSADGSARMERRVKTLTAEGMVSGNPFKYAWDRAKDLGRRAGANESPDRVEGLFWTWCSEPLQFTVGADGKYACSKENYDQLVNKAGAMYWFMGTEAKPWVTEEKIAAPILHNKLVIEFKNAFTKSATAGGKKIMFIGATPSAKGTIDPPAGVPRVADGPIEFTVTGGKNEVQFDTTNHRLQSVKLDLSIKLTGKGQVSDGSKGPIRGEVTFTESQVYKD
jgi:hypothetical protein